MIKSFLGWLAVACMFVPASASAQATAQGAQDLQAYFQTQRESLFDVRGINVPRLSQDIGAAVREGEQLERRGDYRGALNRLLSLQSHMPLPEVPDFDVHMLAGWLYGKLGQPDQASMHKGRADAYRKILHGAIGKGDTPDDPLRVVMVSEIVGWTKSDLARVIDVKSLPHKGRDLTVVTYQGPYTAGQPARLFALIDRRTEQMSSKSIDRYAAIPVGEMRPQELTWLNVAREKRDRFLTDSNFTYLELSDKVAGLMKASTSLDMDDKPMEALEKLRELEVMRPIEEIPTPSLLGWYSYLLGKTGNTTKQMELRGLLFGVQQAIAHSGDGRSEPSAINVILVSEEYEWLAEKKLKRVQQANKDVGTEKFDVLTVTDAQGARSEVFFNVTRLYGRYSDLHGPVKPN